MPNEVLGHNTIGDLRDDCHVGTTRYRTEDGQLMVELECWKRASDDPRRFSSRGRDRVKVLADEVEHDDMIMEIAQKMLAQCDESAD